MNRLPRVSVIVPCYNQGMFVRDLVASVARASPFPHEVIVVNDGSTDEFSLTCLDNLQSVGDDQSIVLINQENRGLSAARNTGLDVATGAYIQFLDADDLITSRKLELQLQAFDVDPMLSVHLTDYALTNGDRSQFWRPQPSTIAGYAYTAESFLVNWERGMSIPIHAGLFRASSLTNLRFNTTLKAKEDWVFWASLAAQGARFQYSPLVGAIYRRHGQNMTILAEAAMARNWLRALEVLTETVVTVSEEAKSSLVDHYNATYLPPLLKSHMGSLEPFDLIDVLRFAKEIQ